MELSRRDALGALSAAGITATAGCSSLFSGGESDDSQSEGSTPTETPGETDPMQALLALGDVLYPSQVEVSEEFVETYMMGRINDEEGYREQLRAGVETLDELSRANQDAPFGALSADQRVSLIEATDLRSGNSDDEGGDVERVNYYLIDELIFAFYASPKGGELVGNTNPRGWPGGFGYSPELTQ